MTTIVCATCGFAGRLYRPAYVCPLDSEQIKCMKCLHPTKVFPDASCGQAFLRPAEHEPLRPNSASGGMHGRHAPFNEEARRQSWRAWLALPENEIEIKTNI